MCRTPSNNGIKNHKINQIFTLSTQQLKNSDSRTQNLKLSIELKTNHAILKHLLAKNDTKPRLIRWISLLQEFDIEIKDRKGSENSVADHLSRIFTEYTDDSVGFLTTFLMSNYLLCHMPLSLGLLTL